MANYVRKLVSGHKARFKDEELNLDLDLVYVTDQLIVMGFPARGLEGFYRNRREDVKKFLDHRHRDNYWVYNLCPLTESSYDAAIFGGRVSRYPFPDHHAPPLAILALASREVRAWLSGASDRVAVLHCKAGKGRSGTLACAYLLSLDVSPEPPTRQRSYTAKQWAKLRAEERMSVVEAVEMPKGESPLHYRDADDSKATSSAPISEVSLMANVTTSDNPTLDLTTVNSPLPTPTLEKVLALHTARRMKQPQSSTSSLSSAVSKKSRQGVSIPSQRRFLLYWSSLLSHTAPSHMWPLTAQPLSSRSKVKLVQVTVRLREGDGIMNTLLKLVNKGLDKTASTKGVRYANGEGTGRMWISLARYDDEFVEELETWERLTRDKQAHLGKRCECDGFHEGKSEATQIFKDDRWDKSKMIRSFARLGWAESKTDAQGHDEKSHIYAHVLTPLDQSQWNIVEKQIKASGSSHVPPAVDCEVDDVCLDGMAQASVADDDIILDACREVRAKLYLGQVIMGWLWFIPTFHMPQPPTSTLDDVPQTTHIRFCRKDVDFSLGIGAWIIDIDIEMEWVRFDCDRMMKRRE